MPLLHIHDCIWKGHQLSSSPLIAHLARQHKIDQEHQQSYCRSVALTASSSQGTLHSMFRSEIRASAALEDAALRLLCAERLPFRLVDSRCFRAVLSAAYAMTPNVRSSIVLPHRTTFSRRVDDRFAEAMRCIAELIGPAAGRLSCTFDIWSNSHTQMGFLAVLVSFLDDNWKFRVLPVAMEPFYAGADSVFVPASAASALSAFSSSSSSALSSSSSSASSSEADVIRHDAQNICTAVTSALARVGIDPIRVHRLCAATTDNGANVVKATKDELSLVSMACVAHTLNLLEKDVEAKVPELTQLTGRVNDIVTAFSMSSLAAERLTAVCRAHSKDIIDALKVIDPTRTNFDEHMLPHRLKKKMVVRWNTTKAMLVRSWTRAATPRMRTASTSSRWSLGLTISYLEATPRSTRSRKAFSAYSIH